MLKKILCAVDLEDGSEGVVRYAADLCAHYPGCQLLLLYIAEIPLLTLAGGKGSLELPKEDLEVMGRASDQIRRLARDRLDDLIQLLGCKAEIEIQEGPPATRILSVAERDRVDLVVLGSHQKGPLQRIFLGSVSDKVAHQSSCPVLIFKPREDVGGEGWSRRMPQSGGGL